MERLITALLEEGKKREQTNSECPYSKYVRSDQPCQRIQCTLVLQVTLRRFEME